VPGKISAEIRSEFECFLASGLEWLPDDGHFTDYGIDSVAVISVAAALRRRFGAELPDEVLFSADASIATFMLHYTAQRASIG
jgi:acyl carrier protein